VPENGQFPRFHLFYTADVGTLTMMPAIVRVLRRSK
jgi:hypothetical protein